MSRITIKKKFFLKKKIKGSYTIDKCLFILKKYSIFNFDESIDLSIRFSNDFLKLNKVIKDSITLPYSYLRFVRTVILVDGFLEFFFRNLGYLNVGLFNLFYLFELDFNFDILLTTSKLRKYMSLYNFPSNIKILIINGELSDFLSKMNYYPIIFKSNKYGVLNISIGKVSFNLSLLRDNFLYFIRYLKSIKKKYLIDKTFIKKISLSSTMGVGLNVIFNDFLF